MKVIAIIAQKGGTGKTTLAVSLAVAADRAGSSVALFDLDPQATATNWADRRGADTTPVVLSMQAARLAANLKTARESGADLVIIDTPPRIDDAALSAIRAADLIVIPSLPAINDLETLDATMRLIRAGGERDMVVVLNGMPARGAKRQQAADVVTDKGLELCAVSIGHRTAFPDAAALGQTPQEYEPGGKAASELEQLFSVLRDRLEAGARPQGKVRHEETGFESRPKAAAGPLR